MPSLVEAIEQKYGVEDDFCVGNQEDVPIAIFVPKKPPRICIPSLLVLNDFDIASAGDASEIQHKCARVEELDLAMNKLEQWSEVFRILHHMPRLKFANLSFNALSAPLDHSAIFTNFSWNQLRNLVLNSTHVDWTSVRQLLQFLPELEELHLSFNDYNRVELERDEQNGHTCECLPETAKATSNSCNNKHSDCDNNDLANGTTCICPESSERNKNGTVRHPRVKKLHFTGNPVSTWQEISKLGSAFPSLESLVLAECPIRSLDIASDGENDAEEEQCRKYERTESESESNAPIDSPHNHFRNLEFLNLNSTKIATWDDIERLARFPKLQHLRVQGCPLWDSREDTQHERRQLIVARLPNVTVLNGGGVISPEERETAERAFIRHYMDKPESTRPDRYAELVSIHGQLEPLADVDLRPEKRVRVLFTYGSTIEERMVDVYRTVQDLKTKLEPLTGLAANRMRLFYVDQDLRSIQGPEEMKYPSKQLYSYNIRSGDEIIIDSKQK